MTLLLQAIRCHRKELNPASLNFLCKQAPEFAGFVCCFILHRNKKNIFNKNERRCREVKIQKVCEQGWEVNCRTQN